MTKTQLDSIKGNVLAIPSLFASDLTIPSGSAYTNDLCPVPKTDSNLVCFDNGYPPSYDNTSEVNQVIERNKFNWLLRAFSQASYFGQTGIRYTFNQDVSNAIGGYPLGAVLAHDDGTSIRNVVSLVEDNTYNFLLNGVDNKHWKYLDSASAAELFPDYGASSYLFTAIVERGTESISNVSGWVEMPKDGWIFPQFDIRNHSTIYLVLGPADGSIPNVTLSEDEYESMIPDEQNTKNFTALLLENNTYQNKYVIPVKAGTKMAIYGKFNPPTTSDALSGSSVFNINVYIRTYRTMQ